MAVRSFSADGPAEGISLAYAKDRKSHEASLSQLRKQWAREHGERSSKAAAVAEAARERRAAAKVQRAQQDKASADARRRELLDQQAGERAVRVRPAPPSTRCDTKQPAFTPHVFDLSWLVLDDCVSQAQSQKERLARAQLREDVLEYARQER